MKDTINSDGLKRLVKLELSRILPVSREEARRAIRGRMGAYDQDGTVIDASINSYFADKSVRN